MNPVSNSATDGNSDSSGLKWKELYQCAMLELDGSKLRVRIDIARHAIHHRVEEIIRDPAGEEQRDLNDALRNLQVLTSELKKHDDAA
jgi:hypothetical protein